MSMIRKIIPVSLYDIPGLEGWLEEQASQGLFPTSLGSWAVSEDRGLPGTRFRLDPFANRTGEGLEPTEEKLELYRQAGWEYAFRVGRAYFLFYTTDPQAPELFSDHQSQGLSLNRLVKDLRSYRRRKIVLWSLLGVLFLAVLFLGYSYDVQPDHFVRLPLILLQLFNPVLLFFLTGLCFYSLPIDRRDRKTLFATYNALKEGLPPPPSPGPSRRIVRENIAALILSPVLVPLVLYLQFGDGRLTTRPVAEFSSPYISLYDLEQVPLGPYETIYRNNSGLNSENVARRSCSLLAPVWYEVSQDLDALQPGRKLSTFSPDPHGGEYTYSPSLDMTYFHTLPILARPVARAQLDSYRLVNLYWSYEEVDWPGADFVILATVEDNPWQMAAVGRGGRVAVYQYAGVEKLADHLDLLADLVSGSI